MPSDRLARILGRLTAGGEITSMPRRLCEVAAEVTAMSGAGIMLFCGGLPQSSLCATDGVAAQLEDVQYTVGEGPSVDAHTLGRAVGNMDLTVAGDLEWQAFTPFAVHAGARAVVGFPVRLGAARLGALTVYRDRPGRLSAEQYSDGLAMADVTARAILALQAEAPPGAIAAELEVEANFQSAVHQATGMVAVQLDSTVGDALVRLRAHAFRTDRLIGDVARDVVDRRLQLHTGEGP